MVKEKDWEEKYKRARADYINLERRVRKQQEEFVKFANSVLILKLLPILDDLERAVETCADEGIRNIFEKFKNVLESEGVQEIKVDVGGKFDPNIMECVITEDTPKQNKFATGQAEDTEGTEAKVVEVLRKGYKIKEKILRPAQVNVKCQSSNLKSTS